LSSLSTNPLVDPLPSLALTSLPVKPALASVTPVNVTLSMSGPLDATKIPDLALSANILDTEEFRTQVVNIISARHPNGALLKDDVLSAIVLAVSLEVDTVSPMLFAPLLVSILKQVDTVKSVKGNRSAKMLLVMELFKAFVITAYKTQNLTVPEALRYLAASSLDSLLAIIIKKSGVLVSADKLKDLMTHQREKLARRAIYLQSLEAARNDKLNAK